jgi:hypothetical protein
VILSRAQIAVLVMRVQNDFLDTPVLSLTAQEAHRRFGVDAEICDAVLGALVDSRVLARTPEGAYVRYFPHARLPAFAQHTAA